MLHLLTHQEFLASEKSMVCLPKPTSTKNGIPYWDFQSTKTSSTKNPTSGPSVRKKQSHGKTQSNSHATALRTRKQLNGKVDVDSKEKIVKLQLSKLNGHVPEKMVNGFTVSSKSPRNKLSTKLMNEKVKRARGNVVVNGKKTEKNQLVQSGNLTENLSNGTSKTSEKVNGVNKIIQTKRLQNGTKKLVRVNGVAIPKRLKCRQCEVCFKTSWQMKEHMWIHTGIKPFPCSLCNLKYVKVSALIKHCTTSHGIDVTYKCQLCKQKMKHEEIYLNHLKTDHSEELKTKELQKLKNCVDAYL